ncbi:MAG TPA: cation:proton antiporter [Candidatus Limnocylindria bacterium]|nr:cation:proton antiporter [Candidatus Limnocylindria bacterium]
MTTSLGLTLLVALAAALVLGAVAHRLRLAPMVGYIAAGLLVGPFTPGIIADREQVLELADLGVALLMFSIGLQFSQRELLTVGRVVGVGAPVQVAITLAIGTAAGMALGHPLIEALFLGAIVSIASSVVMVKVVGERDLHATLHGKLAFAWSVVQDLLTVVLVVVLSALALESDEPLVDVTRATILAAAFVAAVIFLGSRALPWVLARIARLASRELFIVAVAVVAIGTAAAAEAVGVSIALGAFVAGMALADSDLAASVLGEIVPLRELFSTLFFVSVGVLLEPAALVEGWVVVLLLVSLIVLVKGGVAAAVLRAGGQGADVALRTGGLVAQSGEFSFVLATVGLQAGAIEHDVFSQAMGAVVVSILLAGPVAALTGRAATRLARRAAIAGAPLDEVGPMRRHAVIVGYGRIGRAVARVLSSRGFDWVAIDLDYPVARAGRDAGLPLVYGDASSASVLDSARIREARVLVVAIPDALATRQAIGHAFAHNPRLEVVARAHSETDEADLRKMGATRVVVAERQLSNELVRHALRRFGVSDREIDAILRRGEE